MLKSPNILSDIIKSKPIPKEVSNKVISHSQFSTYSKCAFQWKLRYIDKIKLFQGSIHTVFGTSMHETFQYYLSVMFEKTQKEADSIDLETYLQERFSFNYAKERDENNNGEDFSTLKEVEEFFDDGIAILKWFKTHRAEFFSNQGYQLLGVEIPLMLPVEANNNVFIKSFLDFVLYDVQDKRITIYDIKTSTRGWKDDKEKKDKIKLTQILWYKQYFAKQYEIDIDDIDVVFFILKRKIWENADWPQKRVQVFRPPHGASKMKEANHTMKQFVEACFTPEGDYNVNRTYEKNPGSSCKYCPFNNNLELCNQIKD